MDATSVLLSLRILTQVGMTMEQIKDLMAKGDTLTNEDVAAALADDRAEILENATN